MFNRFLLKLFVFCQLSKLWSGFHTAIFRTYLRKNIEGGAGSLRRLWPDFDEIFIIYSTNFGIKWYNCLIIPTWECTLPRPPIKILGVLDPPLFYMKPCGPTPSQVFLYTGSILHYSSPLERFFFKQRVWSKAPQ